MGLSSLSDIAGLGYWLTSAELLSLLALRTAISIMPRDDMCCQMLSSSYRG